jgi:shikimate dehydrogenase
MHCATCKFLFKLFPDIPLMGVITYADLTADMIDDHKIIIQTTPLGMWPETESCPDIPFNKIGHLHICFDLIYNPQETCFLKNL